jgi:lysyl-tRNA synthetase class 2
LIFDNQYIQERIKKAESLKEQGINPYPQNIKKGISSKEFLTKFEELKNLDDEVKENKDVEVTLTGRIKFIRIMGKAAFAKIEDEDGLVQIYYNRDDLPEGFYNNIAKKLFEVGDIIQATGYPFVTKTGELTLYCKDLKIVTKAISPLPEKFHGLQDQEIKYRQRYLDMIVNPEVKNLFKLRSKIVSIVRRFFEEKGFLEVETPMMHPIPGGANARPFITHHNALGVERYLRIAPELYLKRLVVGGMEAVFEINRNFRNEGIDHTHNPEFTMLEFYWAYHTYEDLINLTQELFERLINELNLPKTLKYGEYEIDFSTPFKQIKWEDALVEYANIPKDKVRDKEYLLSFLKENNIEADSNLSIGKLQEEIFDEFVEKNLINPTFLTHYPIDISPLARRNDNDSQIADRFEFFIAGKEIANGFNELNDPIDQYERFKAQVAQKDSDDEAMHMDIDFVRALSYAMPPTAGEGIGIDRLIMMLTNQHSIRDVLLFPAMKPEKIEKQMQEDNLDKKVCKKCGNSNEDELKPAKKGKGYFCIDTNACKQRANSKTNK